MVILYSYMCLSNKISTTYMCVSILKETNLKHPHQHERSSTLISYFFFVVAEIAAEAVEGEALEDGDMQEEDESKILCRWSSLCTVTGLTGSYDWFDR